MMAAPSLTERAPDTDLCCRVVAEARLWLGTPFHHGASCHGAGCDCLGLIRGVWRAVAGREPEPVPAYAPDWGSGDASEMLLAAFRRHFRAVAPDQVQVGNVLVFRLRRRSVASHCGILIAERRLVHAMERTGVVETVLGPWWARRIVSAFAFPEPEYPLTWPHFC